MALAALLLLCALPGSAAVAGAQVRDSLRAAPAPAARRDSAATLRLPQPPVSPRRAFLSSLLVPGYGQARLDRPTASAVFAGVELAGVFMLGKAVHDLRVARRFAADSVTLAYAADPETGLIQRDDDGLPIVATRGPGRYTTDLVHARRLQREDWLAVLIFNHLFAGADAFVSAHLWDVPAAVDIAPTSRGGAALTARFRW